MTTETRTGVFLCCDQLNGETESLRRFAASLSPVVLTQVLDSSEPADLYQLAGELTDADVHRVVLVGEAAGRRKTTFAAALRLAERDPRRIQVVTLRNPSPSLTWFERYRARLLEALMGGSPVPSPVPPSGSAETLVIGGGIAGIQAALEIANAGFQVHLVEKTATIGGHMAQFDKTFPTLDCAACILTPKMVEVGQHPNINLLTYSDVLGVDGTAGDFTVKIRKRARKVNPALCIGCGTCAEKCPAKAPSEFDHGISERKAIYVPFPQAVPNKYVIDTETCVYSKKGKCKLCVRLCPVEGCIDLDEQDTEVDLHVGNIIMATGFQTFDAGAAVSYGYGNHPNIVNSLQFERLINAAGPTGGLLKLQTRDDKGNWKFRADGDDPKSVAILHCVGSRDRSHNRWCSRVCCMYSLKFAHLVREKLPDAQVYEYYIDMRAFGKGYEEFYDRIQEEGVHVIRGKAARVEPVNGHLQVRAEDIHRGTLIEQEVDMVVLSVGLEPRADSADLASRLGVEQDGDGWFLEADPDLASMATVRPGIYLAGACQGPKDIPDTVAQASAAASFVLRRLAQTRSRELVAEPAGKPVLAPVGV